VEDREGAGFLVGAAHRGVGFYRRFQARDDAGQAAKARATRNKNPVVMIFSTNVLF
jgi:hypothetical protein